MKFNESVANLLQASLAHDHTDHYVPIIKWVSIQFIQAYVDQRCRCIEHCNACNNKQEILPVCKVLSEEYNCDTDKYKRIIDGLLVIVLSCLADTLEILGLLKDGEVLHLARLKLQQV
jgi:hypothetical protein